MIKMIREYIWKLMKKEISKEDLLIKLGLSEKLLLSIIIDMVNLANENKDAEMLEDAVYLVFLYDIQLVNLIDLLNLLIISDWHKEHENIAILLQKAKLPSSVEYLLQTIDSQYDYLDYDESYALTVKCIWALGDIRDESAKKALTKLLDSSNEIIKDNAKKQLERISKNDIEM